MRGRALVIWLVLFAVYASTLGLDSFQASDYGGDEPHYLLTAESIVSDGDIDLTDEYATRAYADWYPYDLDIHGRLTDGRRHEPHGVGFPLLIAPAYAVAGPTGVELLMAAIAATAFLLAMALARRLVAEPWATLGPLAVALSPPVLAYGTAVYPELAAGAALTGATLLALEVRRQPRVRWAALSALLLATLPWLGTKYALAGLVVGFLLVRWLMRRRRTFPAFVVAEIGFASLIAYVTVNGRLYGGLTPYAADAPGSAATDASSAVDYLERAPRLLSLWIDRDYGLLRWAPILALAGLAVWLLWRSRRDRIARAIPDQADVDVAAATLLAVVGAQVVVAAFLSPTMYGFWFPGRHMLVALPILAALVAWGLRHAPRIGAALAGVTLLASGWFYVELRLGETELVASGSSAPWGPLERVLPLFGSGTSWDEIAWTAALLGAGALLAAREWRHWRQTAGSTRRAYSG